MPKLLILDATSPPPAGCILVDDASQARDCLNIDHHVGHSTPIAYQDGFTSTERVLNSLKGGLDPRQFQAVCIRHYDADGLIAVWSIRNPERALKHSDQIVSIARYGDFYESWDADLDAANLASAIELQEWTGRFLLRLRRPGKYTVSRQMQAGFVALERLLARGPDRNCLRVAEAVDVTTAGACVAGCVGLAVARRPLRLEQVLRLLPSPLCITAWQSGRKSWSYSILLRPRFAWGYDDEISGEFPVKSLDGLQEYLKCAGFSREWNPTSYDGATWRMDCYSVSIPYDPEKLAQVALLWANERLATS